MQRGLPLAPYKDKNLGLPDSAFEKLPSLFCILKPMPSRQTKCSHFRASAPPGFVWIIMEHFLMIFFFSFFFLEPHDTDWPLIKVYTLHRQLAIYNNKNHSENRRRSSGKKLVGVVTLMIKSKHSRRAVGDSAECQRAVPTNRTVCWMLVVVQAGCLTKCV